MRKQIPWRNLLPVEARIRQASFLKSCTHQVCPQKAWTSWQSTRQNWAKTQRTGEHRSSSTSRTAGSRRMKQKRSAYSSEPQIQAGLQPAVSLQGAPTLTSLHLLRRSRGNGERDTPGAVRCTSSRKNGCLQSVLPGSVLAHRAESLCRASQEVRKLPAAWPKPNGTSV
jgi:hypothetical protein